MSQILRHCDDAQCRLKLKWSWNWVPLPHGRKKILQAVLREAGRQDKLIAFIVQQPVLQVKNRGRRQNDACLYWLEFTYPNLHGFKHLFKLPKEMYG